MDVIKFLENAAKLKKVKRAGWVLRKVPNPESVAEHSFMASLAAFVLADMAGVNKERTMKMALVHDLAESIVGDITPEDGIAKNEKHEKEEKAFETLLRDLDDKEIINLWHEYEERKTPESLFVHDIDKLEMTLQALEYEKKHGAYLEDFWQNAERNISTKHIRALFEILKEQRETSLEEKEHE
ncbi:MAG: HD domain-containing protein [Candidatus Aenigmarchaeota archaeon]|nr:HD domain-containing protein [Candidatus Aenigmarchaeota archaeon]